MRKTLNYMQKIEAKAEAQSRFSNFAGEVSAPGMINPLNRTLTVVIANATNAAGVWVFGGYDVFGDGASAGSDTGITVTVKESSHAQVKRDSGKAPFYLTGAKVSVTDVLQFNNLITMAEQSSTGKIQSYKIQPQNFASPQNFQSTLLVFEPGSFSFTLNGMTYLTGDINAGVTMTMTLTLGARTDISEVFKGQSAVSVSTNNYPYGNAPIIIQAPPASGSPGVSGNIPMMQQQPPVS